MRESQHKKLTRSASDRILAGVFGGFGQYFNCSPNIFRVAYVILSILSGIVPGIIIYIIMMVIIPPDPTHPGILGFFRAINDMQQGSNLTSADSRSRRTLTDVEEKDIKRNGRS
ncbi:PspC domain-containing protein [Limosilactobacillus panis]|uniref:PspC domain-containing protein n=1 Tax=Limosilactobacillus panis TaxID=47493 RepID=UPI001C960C8E|nr:PspC domain-containing protein [Limosilactobacillus panis]QZN93487.1 PspC domain-containing protein [Limosilactobacillus panis]